MSQHGGPDEITDSRSPPGSPQIQVPPGIRRATSQWSEHHNAGTSYFPPALPRRSTNTNTNNNPSSSRYPSTAGGGGGTTGRRKKRSAPVRSASLASSSRHGGGTGGGATMTPRRGTGVFSEADEDADRDRFDDGSGGSDSETDNINDQDDEDGDEGNTPRIRDMGLMPDEDEDPVTLKERQSLINDEHPFGLPIWKPALYRKSRGITREAEFALHGVPVPSAARDLLLPGNIAWTIFFGWWLALSMVLPSLVLSIIPWGGNRFAPVVYGLGWYLFWPFGRYVEGELPPGPNASSRDEIDEEEERPDRRSRTVSGSGQSNAGTVRGTAGNSTIRAPPANGAADTTATGHTQSTSWNSATEHTSLLPNSNSNSSNHTVVISKSYGTLPTSHNYGAHHPSASTTPWKDRFAKACYYYFLICNIAPLLLIVCTICWACVFTIPMAKLTWELLIHMFVRPESIRFCSAPKVKVPSVEAGRPGEDTERNSEAVDGDVFIAHEPMDTGTDARTSAPHSQLYPATPTTPAGRYTVKRAKLRAGQLAPSGNPDSTVLLCIYRAVGGKYYKYTVGGVNILFVNLIPIVFFVIFDGIVLLPLVEEMHHRGEEVPVFLDFIAGQATIFLLSLASVIPLSYFIGMAVASISAQSSIGMGAVINATFGSIIEIILYGIALTQGKGRLVEGSIVGSILAGVLLMPGMSMCSSALRRKEQGFNAKSASVTSTMLIMAIFGTLTPTLFYQTYGNFQLVCDGCPDITVPDDMSPVVGFPGELTTSPPWTCKHCYYSLPDPVTDPFYQDTVKPLMYFCASVLVFSYLIGLWFSLRTHASQIWQNPRQLMEPQPLDLTASGATAGTGRMSLYHRLLQMPTGLPTHYRRPESLTRRPGSLHRKASVGTTTTNGSIRDRRHVRSQSRSLVRSGDGTIRAPPPINTGMANDQQQQQNPPSHITLPPSPSVPRRSGALPSGVGYTPIIEHVSRATKAAVDPLAMNLPPPVMTVTQSQADPVVGYTTQGQTRLNMTTDEFTRAVAVATVSALRQGAAADAAVGHARRAGGAHAHASGVYDSHHSAGGGGGGGGHGGHDAPSWSRAVSATVLLSCTLLYAIIAEILVDVVDVVLKGSGIDEKLLGVTLFALVPNTTEFMNAISFALNGNISLSMEIGSAYALQVCLLQIPAMVAFSAWYDPRHMGTGADTFTLIFPRWDVIAIILSIFLLTYTYIEAKSNYHRGSILILSYLVMASGFYFAPHDSDETRVHMSTMAVDSARPYLHIIKTYALSLFSR